MDDNRNVALTFVLDYHTAFHAKPTLLTMINEAQLVVDFLQEVDAIRIRVGLVRDQATHGVAHHQPGGIAMQLHDTEQVDYTVSGVDAKGQAVDGETFSATSDNEAAVTVTQAGNVFTAVAGVPGSAILTFTDGTLSATEAVDVIAGDVASIQITAGDITSQPAVTVTPPADAPPADAPVDPATL